MAQSKNPENQELLVLERNVLPEKVHAGSPEPNQRVATVLSALGLHH